MGGQADRTAKTLDRLAARVRDGEFYEAQQLYKSLAARYVSEFKYDEAMELLTSGAATQLKHGQITSGVELALQLVQLLTTTETQCWEDSLARIQTVYASFPAATAASAPAAASITAASSGLLPSESSEAAALRVDGCKRFLRAALRWSAKFPDDSSLSASQSAASQLQDKQTGAATSAPSSSMSAASIGSPAIHLMLAQYLSTQMELNRRDYASAFFHFVYSDDPAAFADSLADYANQCFERERDLVITRAVLQCLAANRLPCGKQLLDELSARRGRIWPPNAAQSPTAQAPSDEAATSGAAAEAAADAAADAAGKPASAITNTDTGASPNGSVGDPWDSSPLLHFTRFLMTAADRRAAPLLQRLRSAYKPSIQRDPTFDLLLDSIAYSLFGVPRRPAAPNFLTDMLKLVMGNEQS